MAFPTELVNIFNHLYLLGGVSLALGLVNTLVLVSVIRSRK